MHQSPRRHSGRLQNAYEDGTDEDEQLLLQPADRTDQRERAACRAMGSLRSSPQDQHPRHTQLHAPVRMFADQVHAANDVPSGPNPDAPALTDLVSLRLSGTEHAAPTDPVGKAALPPSEHHPLPPAHYRPQPPPVQRSSNLVNGRPPPPPGCYYSDSPYPEPSLHKARSRQSPEADGQGRNDSSATMPLTATACREDHPQQRTFNFVDPGGGRGLFSSSFEPFDSVANLCLLYTSPSPRDS